MSERADWWPKPEEEPESAQLELGAAPPLMPGDLVCVDCEHAAHVAGLCAVCGCSSVSTPGRLLPPGSVEAAMRRGEALRAPAPHTCWRGPPRFRFTNSEECGRCEAEVRRRE